MTGKLLEGQEALDNEIRVLSEATSICFIVTPWMSEDLAEAIVKYCSALDIRVLLYSTKEKTMNSVKILSQKPHIKIFRDPVLHGKAILTDFELVSGSANQTFSAFNKNDEFIEFRTDEEVRKQYYKKIMKWFNKSEPYKIKNNNKKEKETTNKVLDKIWNSF